MKRVIFPNSGLLRWYGCAVTAMGLLSGCAVEVENRQPAQTLAQQRQPPGSVYTGWRVFQDKCAGCHGLSATGSANAPDLLLRMRDMGSRQFIGLVLQRYDWSLPAAQAQSEDSSRHALIEIIMQRKEAPLNMPAWEGEPRVSAHILDIYAYLSARAQGTQGPEPPAR